LNGHGIETYNKPLIRGWTSSEFLLEPYTYQYLNPTFQRNNHLPQNYKGAYTTDVLAQKAYGLLEEGVSSRKPFFLAVAPIAPHSDVSVMNKWGTYGEMLDPVPANRHKELFPGVQVPRTANFNPDKV
jgi:N-acetylglucosamine-6-sulfatase